MARYVLILIVLLHYLSIYYAHVRCGRPKKERLQTRKKLPIILIKDWVLMPIMIIAVSVYLIGGENAFWQKVIIQVNPLFSSIGIVMMLFGFVLKYWAYKALGRNWSPKLNLYHDQALVKTGPFSFFMHPVYASYFLTFGGYSLFSGNMFFLALSCLYHSLNLIRARTEEKMLQEKFGGAYEGYCLHVRCRQSIVLVPIIVISCLGMIDEVSWLVIGKMPFLELGHKLWVQLSG